MMPFEITKDDIERLDSLSLTKLMKKLMRAEISKLKLKQSDLTVSLDINDPDGGLDGYIGYEIPETSIWLPPGKSGWQFKAVEEFSNSQAEEEVLTRDKTDLKPRIKKLLQEREAYVLVIGGKDLVDQKIKELQERIKGTFENKGYPEGKVKVYSSGFITDWANSIPSVAGHLKPDRSNFKDIEEWRERLRVIKSPRDFVLDSKREETMRSISETIIFNHNREQATIVRIVGLPGVGKTRLIYESLNQDRIKDLVLYTESPNKLPASRFNEIARNEEITAIFVIDECSHDEFVELAKEVEGIGGRMTLITLDYDIDRPRDPKDIHVVLKPLDSDASYRLIQSIAPNLPEMVRRKIMDFSQGFPRVIVLLSENFLSHPEILSPKTMNELGIADLYDGIIAGRIKDYSAVEKVKNVLTMIALFRRLGWDGEVSKQGKKVCELCRIEWNEAKKIVKEQEERGIVTSRGRYRYITPLPFATYLAYSWWERTDESDWLKFFEDLAPDSKRAFLDRLADLPHSEHTKDVIKKILLQFNSGMLDSENGSAIFLELASADRLLAIDTLERVLGDLPREKLLEFKTGRRNVVWALEKIAWWQETFHRAAQLLLKLANAENETWSNNATGTFTQLFQTFLGGTTVPAWDRHVILLEALRSGNKSLQILVLKGLGAAFNLAHAFRAASAEEQGAVIPPPEWNPISSHDLKKSVQSALGILDEALKIPDPEIQTEAVKVLLSHVRTLLAYGFKDEVIERLRIFRIQFPELDKELVRTVEHVIQYDVKKLPEETANEVRKFREDLISQDFNGLLKRYVKNKLLEDELEENRERVRKIVEQLAKESIESPEKLRNELDWLVTNDAENGYAFGRTLGDLDREFDWLEIILRAMKGSRRPSAFFFGGYLSSVRKHNEDLWEKTLYRCYEDKTLEKLFLEIIWRSGASEKSAKLVITLLKNQKITPQEMSLFSYGAWFNSTSENTFIEFLNAYYKIENGKYAPVILGIIHQYTEEHPRILSDAKNILLDYLTRGEIFEKSDDMIMYYWQELSKRLIDKFNDVVPQFLDLVLQTLAKTDVDYLNLDSQEKLLACLLEKDLENTWKRIQEDVLGDDLRAWRLTYLLKGNYFADKPSMLRLIPESYIMEWVEKNPAKAPYVLARIVPIHECEPLFHPLARKLLTNYPNDIRLKSILSDNWHEETFSGPASEHFENKLRIAEKWSEDPDLAVAKWAKEQIQYIKSMIGEVRIREKENGL